MNIIYYNGDFKNILNSRNSLANCAARINMKITLTCIANLLGNFPIALKMHFGGVMFRPLHSTEYKINHCIETAAAACKTAWL